MTNVTNVFAEVVGNANAVQVLKFAVAAAVSMGSPLPTVMMTGPAGTGKTLLSNCVAEAFDADLIDQNCGSLKAADDFENILVSILRTRPVFGGEFHAEALPTVVLWDECHRIPAKLQNELLKPVLEKIFVCRDGTVIDLTHVTHIFATTNPEKMVQPLKDRCEIQVHLTKYTVEELTQIVSTFKIQDRWNRDGQWVQQWFEITFCHEVCYRVAEASRQTPRIAMNLAKEFYRFLRAQAPTVEAAMEIATLDNLKRFFQLNGIYWKGMRRQDFDYLKALLDNGSKPTSLPQLTASLGLDKAIVEREIEPFLRDMKLIQQTKQGRALTIYGRQLIQSVTQPQGAPRRQTVRA